MAEHQTHKHGEMDIQDQEDTFNGFVKFLTNAIIACLVVVAILALFFR
ncbi:aa3-type cytochrome c oxidase subunit IV [Rhodobacteraceae bacterium W635]|nr:aa3-type cytochrome c oxidase subunit IV [Rhodobacteraceae bacterium W635]